jgi:hypothetical protein
MADLKPLGSEKLNGDDKLKRILELTYYKENKNNQNNKKTELVKESTSGGIFGIVKEKDGYYVKRGLNESSLDYIGGIFMKNKNRFSSYSEALKRLELIKGQEDLQEATKYVLKQTKPQQESPMSEPPIDMPPPPPAPAPSRDSGSEIPPPPPTEDGGDTSSPSGEESGEPTDMGGEEGGKRSSYMAEVQKFAGKLGQELRDQQDKMESDDIKYVLNMVISAVDLDKLDFEDLEEIAKKFEREEEEGISSEPSSEEPTPEETPDEEPSGEEELGEYDSMKALEEFIDTPLEADEIDLSSYADLGKVKEEEDEIKELDLEEIKNDINQAISERLSKYFN